MAAEAAAKNGLDRVDELLSGKARKDHRDIPGPVSLFWWLSLSPVWERYKAVGGEAWAAERWQLRTRKLILSVVMLSTSVIACKLLTW